MEINRIVSFLPSATELLYELGVGDKLYGVTHDCLYPEQAKTKPRVINSVFDPESISSKEIDDKTTQLMREGKDIFILDEDNLIRAKPDLIIAQNTCEVCAAHNNQIQKAVSILKNKPRLYSMDPHNLDEILLSSLELSRLIGKEKEGIELIDTLKKRISKIKQQEIRARPKILAIEWLDPFFTAGHWIPEMIEIAGGINLISKVGEHSKRLNFQEIKKVDPELIVLMPCGFSIESTLNEYKKWLADSNDWRSLDAVKSDKVFAVDANSYFSKPSIRTITGLEILAKIFHSNKFQDLEVPEHSFKKITDCLS